MSGKPHPNATTMNLNLVKDDDIETLIVADIVKRIVDLDRYMIRNAS